MTEDQGKDPFPFPWLTPTTAKNRWEGRNVDQDVKRLQLRAAARDCVANGMGPAEVVALVVTEMRVVINRAYADSEKAERERAMEAFFKGVQQDISTSRMIERNAARREPRDPRYDTEG
jgi:hypothetical protein